MICLSAHPPSSLREKREGWTVDRRDQNKITAHPEHAHRPFLSLYLQTKCNDKQKRERIRFVI